MSLTKSSEKPVLVEKITEHLSVGLFKDGRVMTMINGVPFVQCRKAIFVVPIHSSEEKMRERIEEYKNFDELLAARSEIELKMDQEVKVFPEDELFAHKSTIQGWVESGYNIDVIDSSIAIPILIVLQKYDESARNALYYEIERRWAEGHENSRRALLMKLLQKQPDGSMVDETFFAKFVKQMNKQWRGIVLFLPIPEHFRKAIEKELGTSCGDPRLIALSKFLDVPEKKISRSGGNAFVIGSAEYLVLTDEEADEYAGDYIFDNLYGFSLDFIEGEVGIDGLSEVIERASDIYERINIEDLVDGLLVLREKFTVDDDEDSVARIDDLIKSVKKLKGTIRVGDVVTKFVDIHPGKETFVQDAILGSGRGTFISSYDAMEGEIKIGEIYFYIYRMN